MSSNRDRIRDPREEILLETNFDDGGVMTRAYNNNNPNPNNTNSHRRRSDLSIDRYSEYSIHGKNRRGKIIYKIRYIIIT